MKIGETAVFQIPENLQNVYVGEWYTLTVFIEILDAKSCLNPFYDIQQIYQVYEGLDIHYLQKGEGQRIEDLSELTVQTYAVDFDYNLFFEPQRLQLINDPQTNFFMHESWMHCFPYLKEGDRVWIRSIQEFNSTRNFQNVDLWFYMHILKVENNQKQHPWRKHKIVKQVEIEGDEIIKYVHKEGIGEIAGPHDTIRTKIKGYLDNGKCFKHERVHLIRNGQSKRVMSAAIEKSVITMLQGEHAWIKTTSNHHVYHEFKNYKLWFKIKVTGIERSGQNIDFSKLTTEERIQKSKNFYYMSVDSFQSNKQLEENLGIQEMNTVIKGFNLSVQCVNFNQQQLKEFNWNQISQIKKYKSLSNYMLSQCWYSKAIQKIEKRLFNQYLRKSLNFLELVETCIDESVIFYQRFRIMYGLRKYKEGLNLIQKCIEINPNRAEFIQGQAMIRKRIQKSTELEKSKCRQMINAISKENVTKFKDKRLSNN